MCKVFCHQCNEHIYNFAGPLEDGRPRGLVCYSHFKNAGYGEPKLEDKPLCPKCGGAFLKNPDGICNLKTEPSNGKT